MTWFLLGGVALVLAVRVLRRRRALFTVLPSESISTMHLAMSKRHSAKTRAALDVATEALR
jgi:hypothetical protein